MINPIERKKISFQILDQLIDMIKDGVFPVNSKLPSENQLSKLFKVSRPPIREALSILEASGLIETTQGGGSYVKEYNLVNKLDVLAFKMISKEEVYNLLEMRTIIETQAAYLAASRATTEDIIKIEVALDDFIKTLDDEQIIATNADYEFHRRIVKAAQNPFLLQSIDNLSLLYKQALNYSLKLNIGDKGKRQQVLEEHKKIFYAIKEKDSESAAQYMEKHLLNARQKLGDPRAK